MNRDDAEFNQKSAEYQNMGLKSQLKDAQANKTISIVTMTFLPATAVAAICSMEIFDWRQEDKVWVSPHFWIFWVTSFILTAIVIGIFLIWKRRLHHREREQEEEAKNKDGSNAKDEDEGGFLNGPRHGTTSPDKREKSEKDSDHEKGDQQQLRHRPPSRQEPEDPITVHEKSSYAFQQVQDDEDGRRSRQHNRHRSRHRRSPTQSRDRRREPSFHRTASGLSFRGQSEIV